MGDSVGSGPRKKSRLIGGIRGNFWNGGSSSLLSRLLETAAFRATSVREEDRVRLRHAFNRSGILCDRR